MQILSSEPQKEKSPYPILGLLQTSKQFASKSLLDGLSDANDNGHHVFDANEHGPNDGDVHADAQKNPIINKRTLLESDRSAHGSNVVAADEDAVQMNEIDVGGRAEVEDIRRVVVGTADGANSSGHAGDPVILEKIKYAANSEAKTKSGQQPTEGRVVVYGDSNCLDSTHIEKPCFWLLDTLLEYTMTSHVSTLLKDLSHAPTTQFDATPQKMPKRLPNNNLHMYSKVLAPNGHEDNGPADASATNNPYKRPAKRPHAVCMPLQWEIPIYLNVSTATNHDQWNAANRDSSDADADNMAGDMSLRRKLESQKGEVRTVKKLFGQFLSTFLSAQSLG